MVRHFTLLPCVKMFHHYMHLAKGLCRFEHLVGSVYMPDCDGAPFGYRIILYYTTSITSQPQTFHSIHKHAVGRSLKVKFRINTRCPIFSTQSCSQTLKTYVDMFSGPYNLRASNSKPKYLPPGMGARIRS
jgi:hypothetical protein